MAPRLMVVPISVQGGALMPGRPAAAMELVSGEYPELFFWSAFAAAPDDSGFAFVKAQEQDAAAQRAEIVLALDWLPR